MFDVDNNIFMGDKMRNFLLSFIIIILSFVYFPVYGGVVIDPENIYQEGVKACGEGFEKLSQSLPEKKVNKYLKKATKYLEDAIENGLKGKSLKDSYSKLLSCAVQLNDFDRIRKYNSKIEKSPYMQKKFSKIEFQCINKQGEVFKDKLGSNLSIDLPNNQGILLLSSFMQNPKDKEKLVYGLNFVRPRYEGKYFHSDLSVNEKLELGSYTCSCLNINEVK